MNDFAHQGNEEAEESTTGYFLSMVVARRDNQELAYILHVRSHLTQKVAGVAEGNVQMSDMAESQEEVAIFFLVRYRDTISRVKALILEFMSENPEADIRLRTNIGILVGAEPTQKDIEDEEGWQSLVDQMRSDSNDDDDDDDDLASLFGGTDGIF